MRMDTILYITDLHVGAHVPEFVGVFDRAAAHNWRVIEIETERSVRPLGQLVAQWHPAGCILEGTNIVKAETHRAFRGIPVVYLDPDAKTAKTARYTVSNDPRPIVKWAASEILGTNPASCAYFG